MSTQSPGILPPLPLASTPLPAPVTALTDDEVATLKGTIIPLYVYPIPVDTFKARDLQPDIGKAPVQDHKVPDLGHKIGIVVDVTIPSTGATATNVLYEFDTGGKGFWASQAQFTASGQNPVLPASSDQDNLGPVITQYSSGITYLGTGVVATVTLPQAILPEGGAIPSATTGIAVVETILEQSDNLELPGEFPIFGNFFGDFGVSLQSTGTTPVLKHALPYPFDLQVPSEQTTLLTIMAQVGADSLIVDLVTPFTPPAGGVIGKPVKAGRLILGSSANFAPFFPQFLAMTLEKGGYTPPGSKEAISTFSATPITASLALGPEEADDVPVIFDTGAPGTVLHPGLAAPTLDGFEPSEDELLVLNISPEKDATSRKDESTSPALPPSQSLLSFAVGKVIGKNSVQVAALPDQNQAAGAPAQNQSGFINTGLTPFLHYQIMYDLKNGLLRFPARRSAQG